MDLYRFKYTRDDGNYQRNETSEEFYLSSSPLQAVKDSLTIIKNIESKGTPVAAGRVEKMKVAEITEDGDTTSFVKVYGSEGLNYREAAQKWVDMFDIDHI